MVATLSTDGDREYRRGEPACSASGEYALRRCDGFRRLFGPALLIDEILPLLRGMFSDGMCGGDAMFDVVVEVAKGLEVGVVATLDYLKNTGLEVAPRYQR